MKQKEDPMFKRFWNLYGLKRDKIGAERAWSRLTAKDRKAAIDGIKAYRQDCADHNRMMMYAQGYLTHRRWEDEIENEKMKECKNEKDNSQLSPVNSQLPTGTRPATKDELFKLAEFRKALIQGPEVKPYLREKYVSDIIQHLSIPYVSQQMGIMHLCLERDGKLERITEFMIDYYDNYTVFYRTLQMFFDTRQITFQI